MIFYNNCLLTGITISDDEEESNSIVCLEQKVKPIVIDLESESENEPIGQQEILKGLQEEIDKRYLNNSKVFIHDSDHNHGHFNSDDEEFQFEYICQIPFGNQIVTGKSNCSILQSLPEVPTAQDKLLEDRIHSLLSKYKSKDLSDENNVNEMVGKNLMLSIPLKKRRIQL